MFFNSKVIPLSLEVEVTPSAKIPLKEATGSPLAVKNQAPIGFINCSLTGNSPTPLPFSVPNFSGAPIGTISGNTGLSTPIMPSGFVKEPTPVLVLIFKVANTCPLTSSEVTILVLAGRVIFCTSLPPSLIQLKLLSLLIIPPL